MDTSEIQYLIILVSLAFFSILVLLVSLVFYISKRKAQFIIEKEKSNLEFEKQLVETKIEITDQNLKNLSWELHDNIGQLLTVANLELEMILSDANNLCYSSILEVKKIIKLTLEQVRDVSKTLNSEVILQLGLIQALDNEVKRLKRLNLINVNLISPNSLKLENKTEIVIFRMIQEFISNTLKHANATELTIALHKEKNNVKILVSDNGSGFNIEKADKNSGLVNLKSRAQLIGADFKLKSSIEIGTSMLISVKLNV